MGSDANVASSTIPAPSPKVLCAPPLRQNDCDFSDGSCGFGTH